MSRIPVQEGSGEGSAVDAYIYEWANPADPDLVGVWVYEVNF